MSGLPPELLREMMRLEFKLGFAMGTLAGGAAVIIMGLVIVWVIWVEAAS